jgi:hypothetical protein
VLAVLHAVQHAAVEYERGLTITNKIMITITSQEHLQLPEKINRD